VALALPLLVLAGCTAAAVPVRPPLPDLAAAELEAVLAERRDSVRSLRSEATIAVTSPERSGTARQFLIAERPDRLRVEVFSPFGAVFALASADGELAAWVREENRVYRGDASPENLYRWAGLDLEVRDAVDLLLGGPPEREFVAASVHPESATGRLRLRRETPDGAQIVALAADTLLPVEIEERSDDGTLLWRATLSSYRVVSDVILATRVAVEIPAAAQSIDITLSDPEINPTLPATIFTLPTPAGAREVRL
jgi:hypothetical protein